MDGHFVPNISFGSVIVKAAKASSVLPLDVHLMIENADDYIKGFVNAGAVFITVHQEAVIHLNRTITRIKELGAKAGVSINPSTPVAALKDIVEEIDLLLIMSVNPGFGGQSFIKSSLRKIEEAAKLRSKMNSNFLIEVDGGISINNVKDILDAGADVIVAGSSIFKADNISAAVTELKNIISSY